MKLFSFLFLLLATNIVATSSARKVPGCGDDFSCLSWRLGVETNNIRDWATAPKMCEQYLEDYILGNQYLLDSKVVAYEAFNFAQGLELADDGKNIWIFDVDETALSHVAFFAKYGFGTEPIDPIAFMEFFLEATSPALPESYMLYKNLTSLGIKVVFLTGRPEFLRNSTETNLKNVGYDTWEKVILRDSSQWNYTQVEYKTEERRKLEENGYRIVGNIGDQWSDLLGDHPGNRTFKLPNPMYYAP